MLEAALFGGIPQGSAYHFAYPPLQTPQTGSDGNRGFYPQWVPRSPSPTPTLAAQRLLREQQVCILLLPVPIFVKVGFCSSADTGYIFAG